MIELSNNDLVFSFPDVHREARLEISFHRTLRIPDDGNDYPLPPSLGDFPVSHVDDFAVKVPPDWLRHGGVMMPMHQSEALWLSFDTGWIEDREAEYPFAVKIAAGKINAVTGEAWSDGLATGPQDYLVVPEQPWLDGYCVEEGIIRQFVAMPLGSGYSAEEQITGEAVHGGLQIAVFPMKRKVFDKRFPLVRHETRNFMELSPTVKASEMAWESSEMGLAPGGRMKQEIYEDPFDFADWNRTDTSRCFVHLTNSIVWKQITNSEPPTVPVSAADYVAAGLPWFEYYGETAVVEGGGRLAGLKGISENANEKGDPNLSENQAVSPEHVVVLRQGLNTGQVREGQI